MFDSLSILEAFQDAAACGEFDTKSTMRDTLTALKNVKDTKNPNFLSIVAEQPEFYGMSLENVGTKIDSMFKSSAISPAQEGHFADYLHDGLIGMIIHWDDHTTSELKKLIPTMRERIQNADESIFGKWKLFFQIGMYSKYLPDAKDFPGTASFLNSQVTPTFKKMMSISDKDVAEFLRGKETGKLAEFNKKCLDMAKTIKSQKNNPVHVVAMYSDNTYFSKCGATDPTVDIWGNNSKYKTYKQLGYTNPKDFAPIFESWTEFVENTGKIGQLTKAMYTANNALCDFASDKLRVDHTGKLPFGIKELWHIFMYGCCSIYNCDEGWFFTIGGLENNFMSAKRALYRLARVCNVKVGD